VAVWERQVPVVSGLTGLWRPLPETGETSSHFAFLGGGSTLLFSLQQEGNSLTGSVEGAGRRGFSGTGEGPTPITEGKVEGINISFKAANSTYSGWLNGDQLEPQRRIESGFRSPRAPVAPTGPRPAIGPPPDGSDPSIGAGRRVPLSVSIVLHRVQR